MSAVQPIRPAATIIIVRAAASEYEIFMLRRNSGASFAGGMYVFPGGRVDGDDHLHKYDAHRVGPLDNQQPQLEALGHEWRGFYVCGVRETFEEAGLLMAYDAKGALLQFPDQAIHDRFDAYRGPLHAGTLSLRAVCEQENLKLALDRIHFFNRFVTPLGRPRRFDTRFFIAEAPPGQVGMHDDKETVDSIWISPKEALQRNAAKDFDLMNVTRFQLQALAEFDSVQAVLAMAANNTQFPVSRPDLPVDLPTSKG
ncbi:MAG: NUDIX hydrolase [Pseudomonadales bacterium]